MRIICSGTLVTPRVFLTASHCTAFALSQGFTKTYVTFDPNFGTNADHSVMTTPYRGTDVHNPAYKAPYQSDVSLILLDKPVKGITPAKIAPLGSWMGCAMRGRSRRRRTSTWDTAARNRWS